MIVIRTSCFDFVCIAILILHHLYLLFAIQLFMLNNKCSLCDAITYVVRFRQRLGVHCTDHT